MYNLTIFEKFLVRPILRVAPGDGLPYMDIIKGLPYEFFEPPCRNVIVRTQLTENGWSLSCTQICRKQHIHDAKLPGYLALLPSNCYI